MLAQLRYLRYVLLHKFYVFRACRWLGVPLWQAIVHDMSKFSRAEWPAYVRKFGGNPAPLTEAEQAAFEAAWQHHLKHNLHHWLSWVFNGVAAEMPDIYVREMIADFYGAGMAMHKPKIREWVYTNMPSMNLHPNTAIRMRMYLAHLPEEN